MISSWIWIELLGGLGGGGGGERERGFWRRLNTCDFKLKLD